MSRIQGGTPNVTAFENGILLLSKDLKAGRGGRPQELIEWNHEAYHKIGRAPEGWRIHHISYLQGPVPDPAAQGESPRKKHFIR